MPGGSSNDCLPGPRMKELAALTVSLATDTWPSYPGPDWLGRGRTLNREGEAPQSYLSHCPP